MAINGLFLMQRYIGSEDDDSDDSLDNVSTKNCVSADKSAENDSEYGQDNISPSCSETVSTENETSIAHKENSILNSKKKKIVEKKDIDKSSDVPINDDFSVLGQAKVSIPTTIKPVLPKWLSEPTFIEISLSNKAPISELSYLDYDSKKHLKDAGITNLFPVQSSVIPWLLQTSSQKFTSIRPSDICVSAPTGSGKTLAFVLPIVQSLKTRVKICVRALIVLPVAELAFQVYNVFCDFVKGTGLKVILLSGQKSFQAEQSSLVEKGTNDFLSLVDIVVTTPGRVLDHIYKTKGFCLQHLRYLVIDEADRMMEDIQQGWLKQIDNAVFQDCNSACCACFEINGKRISSMSSTACSLGYVNIPFQKLLYSATLSHDPESLHILSLHKPKLFTTPTKSDSWIGKCAIPESLAQLYLICSDETKTMCLYHFLKQKEFRKILCFVDSVERAQRLRLILEEMGDLVVSEISSNLNTAERKSIIKQFNSGKVNLLVCSDLVGRGMDFKDIDCVVSYDVPFYVKKYVHRIGRTARAGKSGTAITLVSKEEVNHFKRILQEAGMPLPSHVEITTSELETYVDAFKKALSAADTKFKNLKNKKTLHQNGQKMMKNRICKDEHLTSHYGGSNPDVEDAVSAGKYVPPHKREGANQRGESMTPKKDETAAVRVTNLSETVSQSNLQELFRPFGTLGRVYLIKNKETGKSKGLAFVHFHRREDAARAIENVHGSNYDNRILNVEWAKQSNSSPAQRHEYIRPQNYSDPVPKKLKQK